MKTTRYVLAQRLCLVTLIFLMMTSITGYLSAQQLQPPEPEQTKTVEQRREASQSDSITREAGESRLKKWTQPIENWIRKNPLTALFLAMLGPILAGVAAWMLKDVIKRITSESFKPSFSQLVTRIFTRFGAYNALLNNYCQTLQRKLKEVGLTQQLLGEGVDLEKNYIFIQLSKEDYKHPETDLSIDSPDALQQDIQTQSNIDEAKRERVEVLDALQDSTNYGNRIAIIGDPGSGKTTLLQYLAYQCTKGEGIQSIPARITLSAYVQHGSLTLRSYLEVLFAENDFPKAGDYIEKQLKKGSFLILLDGFDEVAIDRRAELRRQIKAFTSHPDYLQNRIVITSRPIRDADFDGFRHLEVMPLTQVHRKGFLESKIDDKPESDFTTEKCKELFNAIEEHDRVRKLSENPLLLTFLYHVYKYNLELPRRRVELYRLSVNLMLDWDMETNRPTHIQVKDRDAKKGVLKKIAYYYHTSQKRELPEAELFAQVQTYLPDSLKEKFTAKELIQEIENSSGILRHRTADTYQFIHLTFQEYLTADFINDNRDSEIPKLIMRLHNPWWREATLLLASSMGNVTPLVYRILEYRQGITDESEKLSCLFIAFNCLFEGEVDPDARNQVLKAFVTLPYAQIIDVIQGIVGPIDGENEDLETLFVNILNSPHESVQAWGIGFLNRYTQVAEKSERLTKQACQITTQAFQDLPDHIQEHILAVDSPPVF